MELVFGQAVFHTEGRKFFFLPFPFPVGVVHGSPVPFVLPESPQPFPGMGYQTVVHQESLVEALHQDGIIGSGGIQFQG